MIEAKKLGVKESLVLLDDAALIVSAKNQTVITAMDRNEAHYHKYLQILMERLLWTKNRLDR